MIQYAKNLVELKKELILLNQKIPNSFHRSEAAIEIINRVKNELKAEIRKNGFRTIEDEIHFFKHIKPEILSSLIIYSTFIAIESKRTTYAKKDFKILLKKKSDFIQAHFIDFPEFVAYINSNSTKRDKFYFLRTSESRPLIFTGPFDSEFSTGYDIIAAHTLAFKELKLYFENDSSKSKLDQINTNIEWTAPKVALAELIYALHESGSVNVGKNDIIELSKTLGKIFNIDMNDIYRMFTEIRSRKKDRCRFLNQLIHVLHSKMDQLEALK